mmetsp:Transcript_10748/g.25609  ORF Transcript_10748/g.25609 Transcript_10748/m.25609 type:complete len:467 (-) Transcript_10748:122-1522(-)
MPPVLDPSKSKVDGLAFLGLSLTRNSPDKGHPDSETHQTSFDLNDVLDRNYDYLFSTNDDGWLVGGGEPGPPASYKLAAKDSSHVEIMRIGTYRPEWGGLDLDYLLKVMKSGEILIPQIEVVPTAVVANPDQPPELEIRFDMEPEIIDHDLIGSDDTSLPINWQLRFLHNQLFKKFEFPSRFCPGAFHSTILRKAEFRSESHRQQYFEKCADAIKKWRALGPQPLNTIPRAIDGKPLEIEVEIEPTKKSAEETEKEEEKKDDGEEEEEPAATTAPSAMATARTNLEVSLLPDEGAKESGPTGSTESTELAPTQDTDKSPSSYQSGIWLFTDRENITHFFQPNFLPPYNTPEKKKIILDVLKDEWDETTLSWKPIGYGSVTKTNDEKSSPESPDTTEQESEVAAPVPPASSDTVEAADGQEKVEPNTEDGGTVTTEKVGPISIDVNKLEHMMDDVLENVFGSCSPRS